MNPIKLLSVVSMILVATTSVSAQSSPPRQKSTSLSIIFRRGNASNRPKIPASAHIDCNYTKGCINFEFQGDIDNVYITLSNNDKIILWDGYISTIYNSTGIPELTGKYNIECLDEYGNVFGGTLEFE